MAFSWTKLKMHAVQLRHEDDACKTSRDLGLEPAWLRLIAFLARI
jgi:hypothetical protein